MHQLKPVPFGRLEVGETFLCEGELHVKAADGKALVSRSGFLHARYITDDQVVALVVLRRD